MRRHPTSTDPLSTIPLFAGCSREEHAELARNSERLNVAAGTQIVAEGTRPHAVYMVTSGYVTLSSDGRLLGELGPGDHLGAVSVLSGERVGVTAVAATDAALVEMGEREFLGVLDMVPAVARRVLRDLVSGDRPLDRAA